MAFDDGNREIHGVVGDNPTIRELTLREMAAHSEVDMRGNTVCYVSPVRARHLARSLYRLARRVEQRNA